MSYSVDDAQEDCHSERSAKRDYFPRSYDDTAQRFPFESVYLYTKTVV